LLYSQSAVIYFADYIAGNVPLKRHPIWCNSIFNVLIMLRYLQYHETL
jgi:hypothetical protein